MVINLFAYYLGAKYQRNELGTVAVAVSNYFREVNRIFGGLGGFFSVFFQFWLGVHYARDTAPGGKYEGQSFGWW